VTAEAIDDGFGPGWSAVWFHYNMDGGDSDDITLSNVAGICEKQKTFYEAYEEYVDTAKDLDMNDSCEDFEEVYLGVVDASMARNIEGANNASMYTYDDLEDGEYELGDEAAASVVAYTESPFEDARDDFDADEDIKDGCGIDDGDGDSDWGDTWSVTDGDLVLDAVNDEANASGSIEGEMTQKGDDEGAFSATFTAAYCEIDVPDLF
jgi:hypothetical protein